MGYWKLYQFDLHDTYFCKFVFEDFWAVTRPLKGEDIHLYNWEFVCWIRLDSDIKIKRMYGPANYFNVTKT